MSRINDGFWSGLVVAYMGLDGMISSYYWCGAMSNASSEGVAFGRTGIEDIVEFKYNENFGVVETISIKDYSRFDSFFYKRRSVNSFPLSQLKTKILQTENIGGDILTFLCDRRTNTIYRGYVKSDDTLVNQNVVMFHKK